MRLLLVICIQVSVIAYGQVPTFDGISDDDVETIVKEFATSFVHTSATPPTSLGKVFGAELAMIVGGNESPGVESISKRQDPDSEIKYMPHLWILGGFSIPYGVSLELNYLPELDVEDLEISHMSVGLKWSITDQFFKNLPFNLAVRTYYTKSKMGFRQIVTNPSFPGASQVDVSFSNTMIGGDTLLGFDLSIVEPYFGLGFVETNGKIRGVASANSPYSLFNDLVSSEKSSRQNSIRAIVGCMFHVTTFNVGLEYTNLFSTHRVSAKVGLQF